MTWRTWSLSVHLFSSGINLFSLLPLCPAPRKALCFCLLGVCPHTLVTWVLLGTNIDRGHNGLTTVKGELSGETFHLPYASFLSLPGCSQPPRINVLWSVLGIPGLQTVLFLKTPNISDFVNIPRYLLKPSQYLRNGLGGKICILTWAKN